MFQQNDCELHIVNKSEEDSVETVSVNVSTLLLDHAMPMIHGYQDIDDVNTLSGGGRTPLMEACARGDIDTMKILLDKGAKVNLCNNDGWSALMLASLAGHRNIVESLIENGAQVNMPNPTSGWFALIWASSSGHSNVAKLLIERGADVNVQNNSGVSALIAASQNGHIDTVKLLIEKGADVNMQREDGWSALVSASCSMHRSIILLLLENGAEVNRRTMNLVWTVLTSTNFQAHHMDILKLLIEKNAEMNMRDVDESSVFTKRSQQGQCTCGIIQQPKQYGAEVNMQSTKSSHKGKVKAVELATEPMKDKLPTAASEVDKAIACLMSKHMLRANQLNRELELEDIGYLAGYFDNVRHYLDVMKLLPGDQSDVLNMLVLDNRAAMIKCLKAWQRRKPSAATFQALLMILLKLEKKDIADKICKYLSAKDREQDSTAASTTQKVEDITIFNNIPVGGGAFGAVFKGEFNGQPCAVKVLLHLATELQTGLPTSQLALKESVDRFQQECKNLEYFHHPNVVRHLATRTHPRSNQLVLAMELMDCSLRQYFTVPSGKFAIKLSLTIQISLCHDIASALEYIHSRGVVHRDLCSDNILLMCRGEFPTAKICDFGMSKITKSRSQSVSLQTLGHRGFMPPEATDMESSCYNSKFDIYSFGALMVQIVRHLPTIKDKKERQYELDLIGEDHPVKTLVIECLKESRDDRPSASQLKRRLDSYLPH